MAFPDKFFVDSRFYPPYPVEKIPSGPLGNESGRRRCWEIPLSAARSDQSPDFPGQELVDRKMILQKKENFSSRLEGSMIPLGHVGEPLSEDGEALLDTPITGKRIGAGRHF